MVKNYDFSGYVTKNDVLCSDGRRIRKGAFEHQNGESVPLVWQHQRNDPTNVIGNVTLEHRDDGVYGYARFNDTDKAKTTKALVEHGDIRHMSIFANQLMEKSKNVMHGQIREVSLVLAGANPGALIDDVVIAHADGSLETCEGEAIIYTDDELELLEHDDMEDYEFEHKDNYAGNAAAIKNAAISARAACNQALQSCSSNEKPRYQLLLSHINGILNSENGSATKAGYNMELHAQNISGVIHNQNKPISDYDGVIGKCEKVIKLIRMAISHSDGDGIEHADGKDPTCKEVYESMTEDQKTLLHAMIAHVMSEESDDDDDENNDNGGKEMKQSIFEGNATLQHNEKFEEVISHDGMKNMVDLAQRVGSLKMAFADMCLEHGITDIDYLFDEEKLVRERPDLIARDQEWVGKVYDAASKSPFSRIKSMAANLTADEARAKGYIKGKKKVDEQFSLLKRSTTPQTVYKKQSFDRDDIADINSFDVIGWVKAEMKMMLREELARAILIGDGRPASSDDKINPLNIRPIYGDDATYVVYYDVTNLPSDGNYTDTANALIDAANYARIDYKGSGNPVMFTTSKTMTDLILAKDKNGRRLYNSKAEISSALRVSDIVEVPVMDNVTRTLTATSPVARETNGEEGTPTAGAKKKLMAIIVNMKDYTVGSTKMGQTTMFDDFDIDYNKMKYLIETRCCGALTLPFSAIVLEADESTTSSAVG